MGFIYGPNADRLKLSLLKTGEGRSYQLAQHYGDEGNARVDLVRSWQTCRASPRHGQEQGINIPLETREQTIFSYQASAEVRTMLNGQQAPQTNSREEAKPGKKCDLDLAGDAPLNTGR